MLVLKRVLESKKHSFTVCIVHSPVMMSAFFLYAVATLNYTQNTSVHRPQTEI